MLQLERKQAINNIIFHKTTQTNIRTNFVPNQTPPTKEYSVLSLFSGCGGLDLGFRGDFHFLNNYYAKNPFKTIWANDVDKNACYSFSEYFKHNIIHEDIRNILADNSTVKLPASVDIVLGGFPCQDFSHSGKRKGFDSERGTLYRSMCEVINRTQPKIFLAENVKGLLTMNNGDAIKQIVDDFKNLGYNVTYKLLLTADFNVPQKRERVVIIGTKNDILPAFTFPNNPCKPQDYYKIGDAISDLEDSLEGTIHNHYWSKAKKNKGQGNSVTVKDELAPTMRAEHHGNIEFHWNGNRRLSAREAARIQSFPDDFIFYPSTSSAYKQIGNAVPPVFAWHIAGWIQDFLRRNGL